MPLHYDGRHITTSENRDGYIWLPLPQFGKFIKLYHMDWFENKDNSDYKMKLID